MWHFWPFRPVDLMGMELYRAGCVHGAFVASLVWIILLAVSGALAAAVRYGHKRELLLGVTGLVLAILLWWGSRLPGPSGPAPLPSVGPAPPAKKPAPWRPWRRGDS